MDPNKHRQRPLTRECLPIDFVFMIGTIEVAFSLMVSSTGHCARMPSSDDLSLGRIQGSNCLIDLVHVLVNLP